jgi:ATP-binding cassette subfamily F protein uup
VVVSHDRYLIERICDDVLALLGDGSLAPLVRGVPEYLERRAASGAAGVLPAPGPPLSSAPGVPDQGRARMLRKQLVAVERRLESLARKEADLHVKLAAVGADYALAASLDRELADLRETKEMVELEWLELAESLEA